VKTPTGSRPDKGKPGSSHAEPKKSPRASESSDKHKSAVRSFRFQRASAPGIIEVLNENSYVMAEYSERTGSLKWQRLVLASQREQIEKWLEDHYART
jgi:hypothetical protein